MAIIYSGFQDGSRKTPGQQEEARWRERNLYNVANQLSQAALQQNAIDSYLDKVEGRELVEKFGAVGDEAKRFRSEIVPGITERVASGIGGIPDLASALREASLPRMTPDQVKGLRELNRERMRQAAEQQARQAAAQKALLERRTTEWLEAGGFGPTPGHRLREGLADPANTKEWLEAGGFGPTPGHLLREGLADAVDAESLDAYGRFRHSLGIYRPDIAE